MILGDCTPLLRSTRALLAPHSMRNLPHDCPTAMSKVARVPIKGHEGKHVELVDYTPEEVDQFIRLHLGDPRTITLGRSQPFTQTRAGATLPQGVSGTTLRAPKTEAIVRFIRSLSSEGGYSHTTDDVHKHFFGRRVSYTDSSEKQVAKTTGHNIRKAHRILSKDLDGEWVAEMSGNRSAGATMRWRFEKK